MRVLFLCMMGWVLVGATVPPEPNQYSYEEAKSYADYDSDILELQEQAMRYRKRADEYRSIADSLRADSPEEAAHYDRMAQAYERRAMRAGVQLRELSRQNPENAVDIQPFKHHWEEQLSQKDQHREPTTREKQERRLRDDSWHYRQ